MTFSLALAAAAAFNLVCPVTQTAYVPGNPKPFETKFTHIIRVDLDARRFCEAECEETMPIASILEEDIVFRGSDRATSGTFEAVNRESGKYFFNALYGPGSMTFRAGTCSVAPFTGFPARKF